LNIILNTSIFHRIEGIIIRTRLAMVLGDCKILAILLVTSSSTLVINQIRTCYALSTITNLGIKLTTLNVTCYTVHRIFRVRP